MLRSSMLPSSLKLALCACALVGGFAHRPAASADVYRYVDERGVTQYTDKPRTLPAERLGLSSQRTDPEAAKARSDEELKRLGEATSATQKNADQQKDQKAAAELTAKDKAERCVKARERYDQYMNSQRLYKQGADGAREYLDDAALDNARNSARVSMEELCK
jgi:hypothetical protein